MWVAVGLLESDIHLHQATHTTTHTDPFGDQSHIEASLRYMELAVALQIEAHAAEIEGAELGIEGLEAEIEGVELGIEWTVLRIEAGIEGLALGIEAPGV